MAPLPTAEETRLSYTRIEREIAIRMYNVGFGDAFLLLLPSPDGPKKVLIDCGSLARGPHDMSAIVEQIIQDSADEDGVPRIDVVVATHRHRDHISGFANRAWSAVEVKEVWMPWTENPRDPAAKAIRDRQNRLAFHLARALKLKPGFTIDDPDNVDPRVLMALNATPNDAAMATLHTGFRGTPTRRFLPRRTDDSNCFQTAALPGATIHVVGPSFDEDVIKAMDPPSGQSFLALVDDAAPGDSQPPLPFGEMWRDAGGAGNLSKDDEEKIASFGHDYLDTALVGLDSALNGTSLFLVFQVGDRRLVFPGDAQWGTWRAALEQQDLKELLSAASFYKVSHHGSHNGTPVSFVKTLPDEMWSMTSVRPIQRWQDIPRATLLDELSIGTRKMVRSDQAEAVPQGVTVDSQDLAFEIRIPL